MHCADPNARRGRRCTVGLRLSPATYWSLPLSARGCPAAPAGALRLDPQFSRSVLISLIDFLNDLMHPQAEHRRLGARGTGPKLSLAMRLFSRLPNREVDS